MSKKAPNNLPVVSDSTLLGVIKVNMISKNLGNEDLTRIKKDMDLLKEYRRHEKGTENWYLRSGKMAQRVKIMAEFAQYSTLTHNEMLNLDKIRAMFDLDLMKKILRKQEHLNYSANEYQDNMLLTLQGFMIHNFTNLIFLNDMKFLDKVDAHNVEYNNPYARDIIRQYNREKNPIGHYYTKDFKIGEFCKNLMDVYFPLINGIWCDSFDFAHVSVLQLVRNVFAYGFFGGLGKTELLALSALMIKACQSLKKLEDAWNDKCEKEKDLFMSKFDDIAESALYTSQRTIETKDVQAANTPKAKGNVNKASQMFSAITKTKRDIYRSKNNEWLTSQQYARLSPKIQEVVDNLDKCKEHMACIAIHLITLFYDESFMKNFPTFIYAHRIFVNNEFEEQRQRDLIMHDLPFYNQTFFNHITVCVLNYLSDTLKIRDTRPKNSKMSGMAIEKAFMYVCTRERDCFISSLRMTMGKDLEMWGFNWSENSYGASISSENKQNLRLVLNHMANGNISPDGSIIDQNFTTNSEFSNISGGQGIKQTKVHGSTTLTIQSFCSSMKYSEQTAPDNIFEWLESLCSSMQKQLFQNPKNIGLKESFTLANIPLLLVTILNYTKELVIPLCQDDDSDLDFILNRKLRLKYEATSHTIYTLLYEIVIDNNLGKAQIFKGHGAHHILGLISKRDLGTMIFMNKLTNEQNIGSYVVRLMYDGIKDVYQQILQDVIISTQDANGNKVPFKPSQPSASNDPSLSHQIDDTDDKHHPASYVKPALHGKAWQQSLTKNIIPKVTNSTKPNQQDIVDNSYDKKKVAFKEGLGMDDEDSMISNEDRESQMSNDENENEEERKAKQKKRNERIQQKLSNRSKAKMEAKTNDIKGKSEFYDDTPIMGLYKKKQLTGMANPHFNPDGFLFLILLNRFWTNLYKRKFLNERIRIRNMLALQEVLFKPMSEFIIETEIKLLESKSLKDCKEEELIDRKYTNMGEDEYEMIKHIICQNLDSNRKKQLQLNCCTSAVRVFNEVSKSVFSRKVLYAMKQPCVLIMKHLTDINFDTVWFHVPKGKNDELIKILRFYQVVPGAGWLIDRVCKFEKDKVHNDEQSHKFLITLIQKAGEFESKRLAEGKDYFLKGVLPIIYKYISGFYNLIDYKNNDELKEGLNKMESLMYTFDVNNELLCKYGSTDNNIKQTDKFKWNELKDVTSTLSEQTSGKANGSLAAGFRNLCKEALENIFGYYGGWPAVYINEIQQYKTVSQAEFKSNLAKARFDEPENCPITEEKKFVLNCQIKLYKSVKRKFMTREDNKGLMHFFKKNKDNTRGLIETLVDRQFASQDADTSGMISLNPAMNKYWMNLSIFYYIQTLELILQNGETARELQHSYLIEYVDVDYEIKDPNREAFMTLLCKLNSDQILFMNAKPTVNAIWWNIYALYLLINKFFKSCCNGNFIAMKEFFGEFIPTSKFDMEFNPKGLTIVQFKTEEFLFLLRSSMIATNAESYMSVTDQDHRLIPMLIPLIKLIIETISGPYRPNIHIVLAQCPRFPVYKMMQRLLDDMNNKFYEFVYQLFVFISTLLELESPAIQGRFARNLSAAVLEDIIIRMVKKMFVRERLIEGITRPQKMAIADEIFIEIEDGKRISNEHNEIGSEAFKKPVKPKATSKSGNDNMSAISGISGPGIARKVDKDLITLDPNWITEKLEYCFKIEDWKYLKNFYVHSEKFSEDIIFKAVFAMISIWKTQARSSKTHRNRLEEVESLSKKFHTKKKIGDDGDDGGVKNQKGKRRPGILSTFYWLFKVTKCIEVISNGEHVMIFFPMRPPCYFLPAKKKLDYREECSISDSSRKMMDLMKYFNVFDCIMEKELESYRKFPLLSKKWDYVEEFSGIDFYNISQKLLWMVCLIINILALFDVKIIGMYTVNGTNDILHPIIKVLQYCVMIYAALVLISWAVAKASQVNYIKVQEFKIENPKEDEHGAFNSFKILFLKSFLLVDIVYCMLLHIICAALSILWEEKGYLFNVFHMVTILSFSPEAKDVIKAVSTYFDKIAFTFMLMCLITLLFSLFIMTFLQNNEWSNQTIDCSDLYNCFLYVLNYGLRSGGGIGSVLLGSDPHDWGTFIGKYAIEMSFFFIIKQMFLNVIFSIIVGTFGQLLRLRNERNIDYRNVCFICGYTRIDFAKAGKNFDKHIKKDHDPWVYVNYMYYQKEKKNSKYDFSGLELAIWNQFICLGTDWLPIGKTIALGVKSKDDGLGKLNDMIEKLLEMNQQITDDNQTLIRENRDMNAAILDIQRAVKN